MKIPNIILFAAAGLLCTVASASGQIIADFTFPGPNLTSNTENLAPFNVAGTGDDAGITFQIEVSAVIPVGGGLNGGNVNSLNAGLGSTVENDGGFLNNIAPSDGAPLVPEVLRFTISNVQGLEPGQTLRLENVLSQNCSSTESDQSGGFGGTFGHMATDSVTLTSDNGSVAQVDQSDDGDTGAILLNCNNNDDSNTGNTFAHSANSLTFTDSIDIQLTDLTANDAVVIQGFEFSVDLPNGGDCLVGDVNEDGLVNFLDIAPFIGVLSNPDSGFSCPADTNEDGTVSFLDIAPFILILSNGG